MKEVQLSSKRLFLYPSKKKDEFLSIACGFQTEATQDLTEDYLRLDLHFGCNDSQWGGGQKKLSGVFLFLLRECSSNVW